MEKAERIISLLADAFSRIDDCVAFAVSGSKTSQINDSLSDWDIYIYRKKQIPSSAREKILSSITEHYLVDSSFFEEGDEMNADGIYFDIMYRDENFIRDQIERVWEKKQPSLGYSTCFLHNLKTSRFIFDKEGISADIRKLDEAYSAELAQSIISYNMRMIRGESEGSWMRQIEAAQKRGDYVSRNHRLAALMASYFDILFAYNRVLHPGEKKIIKYAHLLCSSLPENFDEDMERIYSSAWQGDLTGSVKEALDHLEDMLRRT